jgi:hypothetical protein
VKIAWRHPAMIVQPGAALVDAGDGSSSRAGAALVGKAGGSS